MKFLEYTPLARLNAFLDNVNLGECMLKGSLEAYSCKLAGIDRKLSRSLEQEVLEYVVRSPDDHSSSPMGPLCSTTSRRTLIYLILTMNHMYPDYDFSALQAQSFSKECGLDAVKLKLENHLLEAAKVWASENGKDDLLDTLWKALDEVISLSDSEVYSYVPDFEGDPFIERGAIWSFNLFFYNKKLKRVLSFNCHCMSKLAIDENSPEEFASDEDMFDFVEME